jgi:hypothetical protein
LLNIFIEGLQSLQRFLPLESRRTKIIIIWLIIASTRVYYTEKPQKIRAWFVRFLTPKIFFVCKQIIEWNHWMKSLKEIIEWNHWMKSLQSLQSNQWMKSLNEIIAKKSLQSKHCNQIIAIKSLQSMIAFIEIN